MTAGVKHDSGKAPLHRLALVTDALNDVARVLDYGAKKYTFRGVCTCGYAETAEGQESARRAACAAVATIVGSETVNQSTPKPSDGTLMHGVSATRNEKPSLSSEAPNAGRPQATSARPASGSRVTSHGESAPKNTRPSSLPVAPYAEVSSGHTLTTATQPDDSGGFFAIPVTLDLASSSVRTAGLEKHLPTCNVHKVIDGSANWKHVTPFVPRYASATLRHIMAYLGGETNDAESGLPHLAHAATCLLFLATGGAVEVPAGKAPATVPPPKPWPQVGDEVECLGYGRVGRVPICPNAPEWEVTRVKYANPDGTIVVLLSGAPGCSIARQVGEYRPVPA